MYSFKAKCRRAVKNFARFWGYDIVRFPRLTGPYEIVSFWAYAPWKEDKAFTHYFSQIQSYTLVDKRRCFELWHLVEQSAKLKGSLIEIGVWRGGSGALIAQRAHLSQISDPVYLCDTFQGVVKAGPKDSVYKGKEHADALRKEVQKLLDQLKLKNTKILEGIFPEETSREIERESFRFCHIDVDVYESAKDTVAWVWLRLVVGGIIVFDDDGQPTCSGITKYLKDNCSNKDKICIHNLNGHCVWIKTK